MKLRKNVSTGRISRAELNEGKAAFEFQIYEWTAANAGRPYFNCPVDGNKVKSLFCVARGEEDAERRFRSGRCGCGFHVCSELADSDNSSEFNYQIIVVPKRS